MRDFLKAVPAVTTTATFMCRNSLAAVEPGGKKSKPTPIDISSATADYHLSGRFVARNMIDGDPATRWDTDNGDVKRRQAHWAVFGLKSPVRTGGGYLSITLDSGITSWGHHGLGRFRLSVTNDQETIARTPLRQDLKDSEFAELSVALGKAYIQQGQANLATQSFSEALTLAADCAAKARIIAAAAPLEGMLLKLAETASGDVQFQAELARHHDGTGNGSLANVARAQSPGTGQNQAREGTRELGNGRGSCGAAAGRAR